MSKLDKYRKQVKIAFAKHNTPLSDAAAGHIAGTVARELWPEPDRRKQMLEACKSIAKELHVLHNARFAISA